jgi:hypothetical protein
VVVCPAALLVAQRTTPNTAPAVFRTPFIA